MDIANLSELNATQFTDLIEFVNYILDLFMSLSVLIAVVFIVITGFTYIFSFGDENKIAKANKALIFTIVGLAVCLIGPLLIKFLLERILG
jgi:hypothetical protein